MTTGKGSNVVQTAKHRCDSAGVRLMAQYSRAYEEDMQAASMYRILDFLKEEHLVHKLNLINKFVVCSHIRCCQEHGMSQFMICTECGLVEEVTIPNTLLDVLTQRVNASGFSMVSPHLEMACICHNCESTSNAG